MSSKEAQSKAGIPEKRRGQQMGDANNPDQNSAEQKDTPALSGERPLGSKMYADESNKQVGGSSSAPSSTSPSTPAAIPTDAPIGQSGGEKEFKDRQKK